MSEEIARNKPRIAFVVSSLDTARAFLSPHFKAIQDVYSIDLFANTVATELSSKMFAPANLCTVQIERKPSPFKDFKAVISLYKSFRNNNYSALQSVTPKAGLLALFAAYFARVPIRIHWMTGQVWATKTGFSKWYLKRCDRLISKLATHLLVDSHSQREFLIDQRVCSPTKMGVLGSGSICGVDTYRFRPNPTARMEIREGLGIKENEIALIFVGRLVADKGIFDLLAVSETLITNQKIHLILVGPDDEGIRDSFLRARPFGLGSVHFVGQSDKVERYLAASDIFVMPSYREGFGLSVIEAAAVGLPTVGSFIPGLQDAIIEGKTGLFFESKNRHDLASQILHLISNPDKRLLMGTEARNFVISEFQMARLTREYSRFLSQLIISNPNALN